MSKKTSEYGRHFGKFDLDRSGFFDDSPPGPFDFYKGKVDSNYRPNKLTFGPPGLFEKEFKRLFVGEALPEAEKKAEASKRVIVPSSPAKFHSTPGDWHGCIGKQPERFSPETRHEKKRDERTRPNFKTKLSPAGGPGYVDICLNPYPKHAFEPYEPEIKTPKKAVRPGKFQLASAPKEYFTPNPYYVKKPQPTYVRPDEAVVPSGKNFYVPFPKKSGGNKDGCFSKFPSYVGDPYGKQMKTLDDKRGTLKWVAGGPECRSKYTTSIIEYVTKVSCNAQNYPNYVERVFPL